LKTIEDARKEQFIYLTTKGRKTGRPHTVELLFAVEKGRVYLSHEGDHTDWMKNAVVHASVNIRIDGVTSEGEARIAEGSARETGKRALYEKYYGPASKEVIDDWFELSTVLEITTPPQH
jgi:deazaflavin-dependent oxidoreductase (nitroreductase family)